MTHYVEAERARGAVTVPVVRQGTMADPTEVSPDLCRRVPETRERDKDEEGMREKRAATLDYSPAGVLCRHQVLV